MSMPAEQEVMEIQGHPTCGPGQRFLVEVPERFAVARWPRDADVSTICRCILGTLKYEPHAADATGLRRALEGVIEHTARGGTVQKREDSEPKREGWFEIQRQSGARP